MFELPGTATKEFRLTLSYAQDKFNKAKLAILKAA
jgi:hypothetical protein